MNTKNIGIALVALVVVGALMWLVTNRTHTATPTGPTVAVSLYPLAYLVESIAGDTVSVVTIGEGIDPHEYTPSVRDSATLEEADLVVVMGGGLEHWSEDIESSRETAQKSFMAMNEIVPVYVGEIADEHEDQAQHEDEHGHDHGGMDPHSWLDPVLMQQMAIAIANELGRLYPAHASLYASNAQALIAELALIDTTYTQGLAQCEAGEALTSHDAFGYLERRYHMDMHPIVGISTADEPSAQLLAELREEAEEGVLGILTEQRSIQKYAETLARETGLQLLTIDAMELGVPEGATYATVMYKNLTAFRTAYGCN